MLFISAVAHVGGRPSLLGWQRGWSRRGRDARGVGRYAGGKLNNVDEAWPSDSAIVDGALALHGAILVIADVVALLVGCRAAPAMAAASR